tara:strand:- start:43 stop:357 length:315 start_codon:yes stop_codon:yes gene_type:complete
MNLEEIYKHPVADIYKELKMYSEEPGEPAWDKIRHRISVMATINQPLMEEVVWKAMVFDTLKSAYDKFTDKENLPESDVVNSLRMVKMLMSSFEHLNEIENGNK